ncbi:MAG: thiamine phosphate synthase [Desulfobacterales bacterium]
MKPIDYSLYLVTDRGLSGRRPTLEIVRAAVAGGVSCVQLREKACSTAEFIAEAAAVGDFLKPRGVPLIINDRLDVAMAVGADGVHLGQKDMPLAMARAIVGRRMLIGISAESAQDAVAAARGGADYVSASPIFATPTKTDTAPALGLEGLQAIRRRVALPLVAIGGLHRGNAGEAIRMGADGVAVVSAIVGAEDPAQAAREILTEIRKARAG